MDDRMGTGSDNNEWGLNENLVNNYFVDLKS